MTDKLDAVEELKRALSASRPGPWKQHPSLRGLEYGVVAPAGDVEMGTWFVAGTEWPLDAAFIVAAKNHLSAVLSRLEAAEAERDALKEKAGVLVARLVGNDVRVVVDGNGWATSVDPELSALRTMIQPPPAGEGERG